MSFATESKNNNTRNGIFGRKNQEKERKNVLAEKKWGVGSETKRKEKVLPSQCEGGGKGLLIEG